MDATDIQVAAIQDCGSCVRALYNDERPHEALGQKPPASRYCASHRAWPNKPCSPAYPDSMKVRRVDGSGRLSFQGIHKLSSCLAGEPVGLEPIDEDTWELFYGPVLIAELHIRNKQARLERIG